jgi:Fic family protein
MLSSPPRWNGTLRRTTFARAIRGSNSIEGYLVSVEDAIAAVEGEEPLNAQRETWLAVTGYRNAMTYVLQLAKDPNFSMNDGYLRSLHFMMLHYDLSKHPGNWRPGPIWVRDGENEANVYEAPPANLIPDLIQELVLYLQSQQDDDHVLVKAAMAHLNLVMIHPFSDGNGRMARCLQSLVLAVGLGTMDPTFSSIEEYLGRNTQRYYDVLTEVGQGSWHPENDTSAWIQFNFTAHYRQAATLLRRTRFISKLWDYLESEIKKQRLQERLIYALSDAAVGYNIRAAHYRHLAEVSDVVASRDLKRLVGSGMLVASGERRGRTYKASDALRKTAIAIRNEEPPQIHDPYDTTENLITG